VSNKTPDVYFRFSIIIFFLSLILLFSIIQRKIVFNYFTAPINLSSLTLNSQNSKILATEKLTERPTEDLKEKMGPLAKKQLNFSSKSSYTFLSLLFPSGQKESSFTLSQLFPSDQKTFVHFWATWCAPCIKELPTLLDFFSKLQKSNNNNNNNNNNKNKDKYKFVVVAYNDELLKGRNLFERFVKEHPNLKSIIQDKNSPVLFLWPLPDQSASDRLDPVFQLEKIPETFLLEGKNVLSHWVGPHSWDSSNYLE